MNPLTTFFVKANALAYKATRGRLGSQLANQSILLLSTSGRKTGKTYITPLSYYADANNYVIVASNWGQAHDPDWFRNLMNEKRTVIQVKEKTIQVEAHQAQGEEYVRLWKLVTSRNSIYLAYQKKLRRQIPIVVLMPRS